MSNFLNSYFLSDNLEEAYQIELKRLKANQEAQKERVQNASFLKLLSAPPMSLVDPDEYNQFDFLSSAAQQLRYELLDIMKYERLNGTSRARVFRAIKNDCNAPFIRKFICCNTTPSDFDSPQSAYEGLKQHVVQLINKYENISQDIIRENQSSGWNGWKPFFKNLLTLFGLGTSALSRVIFGEYLYGDKLTLPETSLQARSAVNDHHTPVTTVDNESAPLITQTPVSEHFLHRSKYSSNSFTSQEELSSNNMAAPGKSDLCSERSGEFPATLG